MARTGTSPSSSSRTRAVLSRCWCSATFLASTPGACQLGANTLSMPATMGHRFDGRRSGKGAERELEQLQASQHQEGARVLVHIFVEQHRAEDQARRRGAGRHAAWTERGRHVGLEVVDAEGGGQSCWSCWAKAPDSDGSGVARMVRRSI